MSMPSASPYLHSSVVLLKVGDFSDEIRAFRDLHSSVVLLKVSKAFQLWT